MEYEVKLTELLDDLFSGYSFREKVENDPQGDVSVIQMKNLEDRYQRISNNLTCISSDLISNNKFFLRQGDVLFLAKGANNFAIEFKRELPKAIAAAAFFILRPDQSRVLPAFLAWYINQSPVQQYLKENMAGSYIPNVNKGTIEGIELPLPSLELQKKIVAIDNFKKEEKKLMNRIIELRETSIGATLIKLLDK